MRRVSIILIAICSIFMSISCTPKKKEIKEAIKEKLLEELDENEKINTLDLLFGGQNVKQFVESELFDEFLKLTIKQKDYYIYSLIYFQLPDKKKQLIGFGTLNTPFFFGKFTDNLKDEGTDEEDEKETESTKTENNIFEPEKVEEPILTEQKVLNDLKTNQIPNLLDGKRNLDYKILGGDLNQDGNQDYIIKYCIKPNSSDLDAGGGNAMSNLTCVNQGLVLYIVQGKSYVIVKYVENDYETLFRRYINNVSNTELLGINDRGLIEFKVTAYKDDDPRCCPSDIQELNIKYEDIGNSQCHLIKE
jgi:hypothetical protein